ncbi:hypothetical protein SDC9_148316 [bioreactor metagenome]|uniref:PhoU domain-containing protein n=1 Tax=bioreactor metagenome TaxID=1076179 RepID=A0A645EKN0_9ZZZZ
MAHRAIENYKLGRKSIMEKDTSVITLMEENENYIDKIEYSTNQYLVKVNKYELSNNELKLSNMLFHSISDIERVGDHCENLSEIAEQIIREQTIFSPAAIKEIELMFNAVEEILETTIEAFEKNDITIAIKVEPLEEVIDMLKEAVNSAHIKRLMAGECLVDTGIHFVEIATNLERIADHCSNIAFSIIQFNLPNEELNPHEYLKELHKKGDRQFDSYFKMYEEKYLLKE